MKFEEQLNRVVQFAYCNEHSDWYRRVCAEVGINEAPHISDLSDFQQLPVLTRSTLNRFAPFDRLSTPIDFVDDIRSTSGTSGQAPLFYLRKTAYRHMARCLVRAGARRKMYLWGYQHVATHIENDRIEGLQTVICDPQQLRQHVPLVSAMKADTLAGTPSLLLLFGRLCHNLEDRLQIRFLELTGEPLRQNTLKGLKYLFPLAKLFHHYAMGEMGQETGIRGPECDRQEPGYYHLNPEGIYAEEFDGELLVTQLNVPTSLPLIRYRTGDRVKWLGEDSCRCGHQGVSFELDGRANVDFVRIGGVELRYEEICSILEVFGDDLMPYAEVIVRERSSGIRQRVSVEIVLVPECQKNIPALEPALRDAIVNRLRLSSTSFYKDMLEAGLFDEPVFRFLKEVPINTKIPGIRFEDM